MISDTQQTTTARVFQRSVPPTIGDNIMARVSDSTDDDEMAQLLNLFDGVNLATIPVEAIADFVLTKTDNDDLWLADCACSETWDAAFSLLCEDTFGRIPPQQVYDALEHAIDGFDEEEDDDNDALTLSLQWMTKLALLVHCDETSIDEEILDRLKEHTQWQCRLAAVEILADLERFEEVAPFMRDADTDVASAAISALPASRESILILDQALATNAFAPDVMALARLAHTHMHEYLANTATA